MEGMGAGKGAEQMLLTEEIEIRKKVTLKPQLHTILRKYTKQISPISVAGYETKIIVVIIKIR